VTVVPDPAALEIGELDLALVGKQLVKMDSSVRNVLPIAVMMALPSQPS
jgi:hypothetical protein